MAFAPSNRSDILRELVENFGKTLNIGTIKEVAKQNDYNAYRSKVALQKLSTVNNNTLLALSTTRSTASLNGPGSVKVSRVRNPQNYTSTFAIEEAIDDILKNYKLLILLRGLPGSGKSFLAKCIVEASLGSSNYTDHIFSADTYFVKSGRYVFDFGKLTDAHRWTQRNVSSKMSQGYSPLIVDNTNTKVWEMQPYAQMAAMHGYKIRVLEVNTKWSFNCTVLAKRNQHGVPKQTIEAMLDRYEKCPTPEALLAFCNLSTVYQTNPGLRTYPPVYKNGNFVSSTSSSMDPSSVHNHNAMNPDLKLPGFSTNQGTPTRNISREFQREVSNILEISDDDEDANVKVVNVVERGKGVGFSPQKIDLQSWGTDEVFLRSWDIVTAIPDEDNSVDLTLTDDDDDKKVEVSEKGTDTNFEDYKTGQKVLFGRYKDINPISRGMALNTAGMLDKGCWTEDDACPDRDEDLRKLADLFQNVPAVYIRDMYDDCRGDFDMTVEIFLEDNKDYNFDDNIVKDTECMNQRKKCKLDSEQFLESNSPAPVMNEASASGSVSYKDLQMLLNFANVAESIAPPTIEVPSTSGMVSSTVKATDSVDDLLDSDSDLDFDNCASQTESDSKSEDNDVIELNLGFTMIEQLEQEFCVPGCDYPKGFQPVVQVPKAFARQLYAFYVESVYQQMEAQKTVLDKLVKEDEAFARKLYEEENGLARKPQPEGLREIMNEQVALNVREREVAMLRDVEPQDLASHLTRKKLIETFPTVEKDMLLEIFHANSRDYKQTVEDLMVAVDLKDIRNTTNIVEPPISQTVLQELEQAHKMFNKIKDCQEETRSSQSYRDEANDYLKNRTDLYQKAQEYYSQGQREVAQFYSQLAQKQTQFYDMANNRAATVLLDEHSQRLQNFDTLDLHYLFVKEAIPALDVFIDRNINLLQGGTKLSQNLLVITGRGNRSKNGLSKIKPAVIGRLKRRNIQFVQLNPGLLKIKVNRNTLPTNDLESHC